MLPASTRGVRTLRAAAPDFEPDHLGLESRFASNPSFQLLPERASGLEHLPAREANDVDVKPGRTNLVEVPLPGDVHEIQFVDEPRALERFERSVDGRAVDGRVLRAGQTENGFGIEMLAGFVEQRREEPSLPRQA
jgi:hypothetical protein